MKKEKFDSMAAFTAPIYLPDYSGINTPIYGIAFTVGNNDRDELAHNIEAYISRYLCGACSWIKDGGTISEGAKDVWYDANGVAYRYDVDEYLIEYCKKASKENPIRYNIIFGNMKFKKRDLDGSFIIREI